jgi:large conductance mechanosensitive channel
MFQEFKKFILRGNVMDMAVGIVIGAAFGKIVTSLVGDILMPPLGLVLGHVDFSNLFISLSGEHFASLADAKKAGGATINYGVFLNTILEFLIIALALFIFIRAVNRMAVKPPEAPAAPTNKDCPYCFSSIAIKATRCPNCTSDLKAA